MNSNSYVIYKSFYPLHWGERFKSSKAFLHSMKIGMMNDPAKNAYREIEWAGKHGFDFIDLTIEPPKAEKIDAGKVKALLKKHHLDSVGHSAWYLPFNFPYREVRDVAKKILLGYLRTAQELGMTVMNLHFLPPVSGYLFEDKIVGWYADCLNAVIPTAKKYGIKIMIENISGSDEHIKQFAQLFRKCHGLYLHLDVGHANLETNRNSTEKFLKRFSKRLLHVHFSDNLGLRDDHVTLRKGIIDWKKIIRLLKKYKYNKTITLEVFDNRQGLLKSKDYLKKLLK